MLFVEEQQLQQLILDLIFTGLVIKSLFFILHVIIFYFDVNSMVHSSDLTLLQF